MRRNFKFPVYFVFRWFLPRIGYSSLCSVTVEQTGDLKEARDAYLHTQLLFGNIEDPAAEALSRLSEIFAKLNDPKRANASKRELQSKYRSSYWRRAKN